jgi:two-component system, OmpR family, sensor kinase
MSIRLRLASWCAAIFCVLFIGLGLFVYAVHVRAQYRDLDDTIAAVTSHYQSELDQQLASGRPLSGELVAAISTEGQQLVDAELTIYDASGGLVFGRSVLGAMPLVPPNSSSPHSPAFYETIDTANGRFRVHTLPLTNGAQTVGYVQISASLARLDNSIARFRVLLMVAAIGGLIVAIIGSLATVARALRPIADVTETARAIALSGGFGRRLDPVAQRDELGELTRTFNEMLSSLDAAHQAQRRFVDDAAHELRAPLTSIVGNLDLVQRARDLPAAERDVILADVRAEAERVGRIVNELLTLARADAGQRPAHNPVDLDRILIDVVRQAKPLANGVELSIAAFAPVVVLGDADRLRQLLLILVENALRYTPIGGKVSLALRVEGDEARLAITDTGIGIDPDDLPRIFDRFFRSDPARSRIASGSGLGLAIAKWIAETHDGQIEVDSQPGGGSTFTVVLPRRTPASILRSHLDVDGALSA